MKKIYLSLKRPLVIILPAFLVLFFSFFCSKSIAQVPSGTRIPDARYGDKGFRTEKTTETGEETTQTTEYYEVRVIGGKNVEILKERTETITGKKSNTKKVKNTKFQKDGTTPESYTEYHTDNNEYVFSEAKTYDKEGRVKKGDKYEKKLDGRWWGSRFDPVKQEYRAPEPTVRNISSTVPGTTTTALPLLTFMPGIISLTGIIHLIG